MWFPVSGPAASPGINGFSLAGTSLVISGTNGSTGLQYEVLTTTNLTVPRANWISIATNTFSGGNFSVTNAVAEPQQFFSIQE